MQRRIDVDVRQDTWPNNGQGVPPFPNSFQAGLSTHTVDIPSMLLTIGFLTTPTVATGVSLSEFWAWVRYLSAITDGPDLQITREFSGLDSHQKTILSDDFGMGLPILWLAQRLDFVDICDGRYFVSSVARDLGIEAPAHTRRGPQKAPDFVAKDAAGVWHVVECKGTQSGLTYLENQIGTKDAHGNNAMAGVAQKLSIPFPPGYAGQRLVAGLKIGAQGQRDRTRIVVIDPEREPLIKLSEASMPFADDAAKRAVLARALRLAGFDAAADTTASPFGAHPSDRPYEKGRKEDRRRRVVDERDARARSELGNRADRTRIAEAPQYIGRALQFDLPRPLMIGGRQALRVRISQGVNEVALQQIAERPTVEQTLAQARAEWTEMRGKITAEGAQGHAVLRIGELFRSEMTLE